MIQNEYGFPPVIDEEIIREQNKRNEKRALRGRCISTGLLCIICIFTFTILAVILSSLMANAYSGTPLLYSEKLNFIPDMILNAIVSLVGFGVVAVIFCKVTKTDLGIILPSEKMSFKKLWGVVVIGLTLCISANYIAQLFAIDLSIFGLETMYSDALTGSTSFLEHIIYIVAVAVVPAVTEELVFRGCIMGRLRKYGDGFALITSALLFGIMHGNFTQAPFAFVVGLATGWAVIYTNSIFPAMLIHGFNNFMSVIADILYENLETAGIDTIYVDFTFMMIYSVMFALALLAVYKLSKNDKNFCKLKAYEGELSFKERIQTFFTSATIIIFLAMMLLECVTTLRVIE